MIFKATPKDATAIAQMAVIMWQSHTAESLAEEFKDIIRNDDNAVFLMSIESQIIGFAECGLRHDYVEGTKSSPVGYLEGIFIKEKYRKHGYAKELLKKCEEWAKEKGCFEFASDCELENAISQNFHSKMGFSETNRIICFTKRL